MLRDIHTVVTSKLIRGVIILASQTLKKKKIRTVLCVQLLFQALQLCWCESPTKD